MRRLRSAGLVSAVLVGLMTAAACGNDSTDDANQAGDGNETSAASEPASEPASEGDPLEIIAGRLNFDFTDYCGDKPVVVGILDSYGGNAWAVGKRAMLTKFAESCPNVTDVLYADANGDLQKYISAVNSLAAQGANVIETFDLFGSAALPAFQQAQRAGVMVGQANAAVGDAQVPRDLTAYVLPDFDESARLWVEFLSEATNGEGRIAYVGGPAGNEFDEPSLAAIERAVEAEGMELVTKQPLVGAWDPATTQQVVAGLLQTDKDITGVITTYNATIPAILRAFEAAGVEAPALTGQSSSMELVCIVSENPELKVQSLDGSTNLDAIALAKLLAAWSGIDAPELGPADGITGVTYAEYINTEKGVEPECDPSLPPGADLSTPLDPEELAAALE